MALESFAFQCFQKSQLSRWISEKPHFPSENWLIITLRSTLMNESALVGSPVRDEGGSFFWSWGRVGEGRARGYCVVFCFQRVCWKMRLFSHPLNSFVYKCVCVGASFCVSLHQLRGWTMSVGKRGLDAEIGTRGEEGQGFLGPAVAPWLPCVVNIPHFWVLRNSFFKFIF